MTDSSQSSNPYSAPRTSEQSDTRSVSAPTTGKQVYNVVTDTVGGLNVRKSDNLFQLKAIAVCVLLLAPIGGILGFVYSDPNNRAMSALMMALGLGFVGVVLGLFGSGIFLMIYRFARHVRGKHD